MGNGECFSGFGKRVCPFISGKSSMTGTHWKLRASQKGCGWRNVGAEERSVRAD